MPQAVDRPWLPNLLREMADAFGLDVALAFARRFGGRYLHLPKAARADHPVASAVGVEVLAWLIARHDQLERIVVPKGPNAVRAQRVAAVREMTAAGRSAEAIAAAVGMHVRDVHRARAKVREAEAARQGRFVF
jgi:hypothetical protein